DGVLVGAGVTIVATIVAVPGRVVMAGRGVPSLGVGGATHDPPVKRMTKVCDWSPITGLSPTAQASPGFLMTSPRRSLTCCLYEGMFWFLPSVSRFGLCTMLHAHPSQCIASV